VSVEISAVFTWVVGHTACGVRTGHLTCPVVANRPACTTAVTATAAAVPILF
jgi:hypothetical protein